MLQRPQTVFLLLGAALLVLFASLAITWLPGVATLGAGYATATLVVAALAAVVALGAVFLYKDRARQRTVIGVGQGLALAATLVVLAGLFLGQPAGTPAGGPTEATAVPYLAALMPLAAFVLLRLARRGVDRDIATIRSMDRLR